MNIIDIPNTAEVWALTDPDIELGDQIAAERIRRAHAGGYHRDKFKHANMINGNAADYFGAWAEIAAARYLNVPIPDDHARRYHNEPDLDPDIEVRWNEHGHLVIRNHDRLEGRFVLVTGTPNPLILVGWVDGADLDWKWRRNPGGYGAAWFVPADKLRPMAELADKIKQQ